MVSVLECFFVKVFNDDMILLFYRKVDIRLHGKGNSNTHGARPVLSIITMMKWIPISRLSIKNSLSFAGPRGDGLSLEVAVEALAHPSVIPSPQRERVLS